VNTILVTQPFSITNKSKFIFSENSGFVDSAAAAQVLGKSGYIGCKIDLLENATNKLLGTIKNTTVKSANATAFNLIPYSLNTKAMESKTVKVRITISTSLVDPTIALEKKYSNVNEATGIAKTSIEELTLDGKTIPTSYALEQNYPNPFNPSTTIRYQIPNAGQVTMKVYDMLGREVATLVDGLKEAGYYTATFDGAKLASGIYIARLTAQSEEGKSFTQTKKMVMLK
jgi:hypothetical protein